jgi:hypothetical protein
MDTTRNNITIAGPVGAVFDLVTEARLWPRWHPATREVAGVVERPYQLGDVIQERDDFGSNEVLVTWRVVEHERPRRITLKSESHYAQIDYIFEPQTDGILYTRILKYEETGLLAILPDPSRLRLLMHELSERGLARMKQLIEGIIRSESNRLR